MEGCHIVHTAVVRKERLLGKRQRLATEEVPVVQSNIIFEKSVFGQQIV